jgi:hypothetical protein
VIPRGYPQLPVRAKLTVTPWLILAVVVVGVLDDRGVIDLHPGPPTTTGRPAVRDASSPRPSRAARADIPARYLALYRAAARACPGLSWTVLAGIGKVESDHGRSGAPGVRWGVNRAGCCAGPMQFNIRNGPPSTWDTYGDGVRAHVYQARHAIPAALRLLCANGGRGGRDVRGAVYAYNHAGWYVRQVLAIARRYQAGGGR